MRAGELGGSAGSVDPESVVPDTAPEAPSSARRSIPVRIWRSGCGARPPAEGRQWERCRPALTRPGSRCGSTARMTTVTPGDGQLRTAYGGAGPADFFAGPPDATSPYPSRGRGRRQRYGLANVLPHPATRRSGRTRALTSARGTSRRRGDAHWDGCRAKARAASPPEVAGHISVQGAGTRPLRGGGRSCPDRSLRALGHRAHVDDEPVPDVGNHHPFIGVIDLVGRDDLDVGADPVLRTEVQHFLGLADAADE